MFLDTLLQNTQNSLAQTTYQLNEQLRIQLEQLSCIDIKNQKILERLQKELEKLHFVLRKVNLESDSNLSFQQENSRSIDYIQVIKSKQYQYEIKMKEDLELPCYRNRIFSIKLSLMQGDQVVQNTNNLLVELQIWTYDKIPKKLTHNNHNQSIYKGCQQTQIKKGNGCLGRIQIREVSSHFPKGQFILLIIPVDDSGVVGNENLNQIKKEWIKPLIIHEVAIKAKKFSDRHNPYFIKSDGTITQT